MRVAALIALLLLVAEAGPLHAQMTGRVVDERTGAAINGARLVAWAPATRRETFTERSGVYAFTALPPGEYALHVEHPSYEPSNIRVLVAGDRPLVLDIPLAPQPILLAPLVVPISMLPADRKPFGLPADSLRSAEDYARGALLTRPGNALGELASSEATQPPHEPGVEEPHALHILGSSGERGAVVIDGLMLNAPLHLGGLLPQLNPQIVPAAALRTGGAPARYDGGASYIMEYRTRAGSPERARTRGDLSVLAADVAFERPLGARASMLAGARRINRGVLDGMSDQSFGYDYHDGIARLDWSMGPAGVAQLLVLGTRESIRVPRDQAFDEAEWSNAGAALSWRPDSAQRGPQLHASFSRGSAGLPLMSAPAGRLSAAMDRLSAGLQNRWTTTALHIDGGFEVERVSLTRKSRAAIGACTLFLPCSSGSATTISGFADASTLAGSAFSLRAGLRTNLVTHDAQLDVLPRVAITYAPWASTTATLSWGRFSQVAIAPQTFDPADTSGSALPIRREHSSQLELRLSHTTQRLAWSAVGNLLRLERAEREALLVPGGEMSAALNLGPVIMSSGVALRARRNAAADTAPAIVQRQAFLGVSATSRGIEVAASVVHGTNLPLTSIVLDGVAPPIAEPYTPLPPARTGGRAQTRLDAGIKGSWTLQLAGRPVHVAPYMRIVNAFNSSALFYYQQGGSADLRPLSALPTLPVLGVKWEF